ncbi:Eco57I restriction-modification methylase domain-containing protein [Thermococcus sp. 5-4]|uniref:Eco57I restriction-modification methylase domain-containing protein n=1 Tax=Thermococcus sp. 5-4 TaxID=2008440 RepID=UPI000B4A4BB8|nr:Eco57I restriction-modification methylase domain-containing protein [Thermococcus sp. 5-4]ASA78338.1 hypothetical protein CDI07_08535 [Thermococcus sp. 5-4]
MVVVMSREKKLGWSDFLEYELLKGKLDAIGYPQLENVKQVWQTWYMKYKEKDIPAGDEIWFRLRLLEIDPVEDKDDIFIIKKCEGDHRDCVSYLRTLLEKGRKTTGLVDPDEEYSELMGNIQLASKEELNITSLPGRPRYAIVFSNRGITFIGPSPVRDPDAIIKSPDKITEAFKKKLKSLARSLNKPSKFVVVPLNKLIEDREIAEYYFPTVWKAIFDRRDIIEDFFQLFRLARSYLYDLYKNHEITGITDDREIGYFIDELMLQLLIVWYLQSRGFLPEGREKPYLIEKFLEVKDRGKYSYFEFLKRLFKIMMGNDEECAINDENTFAECPELGRIFITGPAPFLTSIEKLDQVKIPNKAFYFSTPEGLKKGLDYLVTEKPKNLKEKMRELGEEGVPVLAIFESRDWTSEGAEGEIDRYVIGAIFEKLLDPEARKGRGAYYTPEEITKYIAENTIKPYLIDKLNEEFETEYNTLDDFFNEDWKRNGTDKSQKERQYIFLFNELRNLKIIDPAVGSGHFLESAIEVLVDIYKQIRNAVIDYGFNESEFAITTVDKNGELVKVPITELKAGDEFKLKIMFYIIISSNIYGVDIDPRAVSLTRARLFLTLAESFDPTDVYIRFPNVHFNIRPGNSLIGFITVEELYSLLIKEEKGKLDRWLTFSKPASTTGSSKVNLSLQGDTKDYIGRIEEKLKNEPEFADGRSVVNELRKLEVSLNTQLTRELFKRFLRLKSKLARILLVSLDTKYAQEIIKLLDEMTNAVNDNLNQELAESLVESLKEKNIKINMENLKELLDDLSKIGTFHWPWEFPEVFMEKGGFDIVIGNPPYGEINKTNNNKKLARLLSILYKDKKVLGYKLQDEGRKVNIYKVFLERSYDLLAKGGYLGMIFPAPFLNDSTSVGLRKTFFEKGVVRKVLEFPEKTGVFKGSGVTQAVTITLLQKVYGKSEDGDTGDYSFDLVTGITPEGIRNLNALVPIRVSKSALRELTGSSYVVPLVGTQEEWEILAHLSRFPKLDSVSAELKQGDINETKDKEFLGDEPDDPKVFLVKGIHLDRYYVNLDPNGPKPRWVKDFNRLVEKYPSVRENIRKERLGWRAVVNKAQVPRLKFSLVPRNVVLTHAIDFMVLNDDRVSPKYLLALLNSRLLDWFFQRFSSSNNITMPEVRRLPVVLADRETQRILERLGEYLTFLKIMENEAEDEKTARGYREAFEFFDNLREAIVYSLYFGDVLKERAPIDEIGRKLEDIPFDEWFEEYHNKGLTEETERFNELSKGISTKLERLCLILKEESSREYITALQHEWIPTIEERFQRPLR